MVDLHSPIKMKGKFSRKTVEWRDGKLYGDDGLVQEILSYAKNIEKTGNPVFFQDVNFGYRNLLKTNITAYALACMVDEMEIVGGKLPKIDQLFPEESISAKTTDGGAGSGNFGHSGRPGEVGGSGKGGGKAYRTGSKEKGYKGVHKSEEFKGIAMHASASKDYHSFISSLSTEQKSLIKQQHKDCGTSESLQQYTQRLHKMLSTRGKKPIISSRPKIAEGKDITKDFKWDKEKFPHEINDVLHEQGFDGPPRVVDGDEFDRIVKEHPEQPLLFRSYTAPDKEALDAYDKQLEGGDWYVDCGTGGAQYGQGMYCAGVYDHQDNAYWKYGAKSEMAHYRGLNEDRLRTDNGFRDTPVITTFEKPEYLTCPIAPDKAYKLPQNDDEWKPVDDADIKPGSIYCVREDLGVVQKYKMLYADEDKKLFYIDDKLSVSETDLLTLKEGSKIAECEPVSKDDVNKKPVSTTRQMTLDPSAKIIDHATLRGMMNGTVSNDEIKALKEEVFSNIVKSKGSTDMEIALARGYSNVLFTDELREAYVRAQEYGDELPTKEWRILSRNAIEIEKEFRELYSSKSGALFEERSRLAHLYRKFDDEGSLAAALGYDAINAKGHGETGSYTVVLNRTKVILNRVPWEVN